jgi:hypothetical protein
MGNKGNSWIWSFDNNENAEPGSPSENDYANFYQGQIVNKQTIAIKQQIQKYSTQTKLELIMKT